LVLIVRMYREAQSPKH